MVRTKYGYVEGIRKDGCIAYLGIPFAKPPVGKRAFRHPEEPEPWEGVLQADHGSKNPIQESGNFGIGNNSLDCLYLNVFVPEEAMAEAFANGKADLPVMVWIYGGAFSQGGAGAREEGTTNLVYNFYRFARETKAIVVSFNYRLNFYGFLGLGLLNENFHFNNGLFDQIRALTFVKENIAAFGGDPANVTLFGQSAGGGSILALMSMDAGKGLFQKAILQSPGVDHFFTPEEAREQTVKYLRKLGVRHLSELFTIPVEKVQAANRGFTFSRILKGEFRCAFSPVIDGVTLREVPKVAALRQTMPLLIGNTDREGDCFVNLVKPLILPVMSGLLHLKPQKKGGSYKERVSDAISNRGFIQPEMDILAGYAGPTWRYEFCHTVPGSSYGTGHAAEIPFELGAARTLDGTAIPEDDPVGADMRRRWGHFAHNGSPDWPSYAEERYTYVFQ